MERWAMKLISRPWLVFAFGVYASAAVAASLAVDDNFMLRAVVALEEMAKNGRYMAFYAPHGNVGVLDTRAGIVEWR